MDYEYIIQNYRSSEEWPWVLKNLDLFGVIELSVRYGGADPDGIEWFEHEAIDFKDIPIDVIEEIYLI